MPFDSVTERVARWWERLPENYYLEAVRTELDQLDPLKIMSTAALDRVLRSGLGSLILLAMGPRLAVPGGFQRQLREARFYKPLVDAGDADAVFLRPPEVRVRSRTLRKRRDKSGRIRQQLSFESPYRTLNPALRRSYPRFKRNRTAHARYWTHPDGPRPTMVFMHGVCLSSTRFNSRMFYLPWFYRKGYDILLLTMPFHGPRADRPSLFNGYGWFAHGFSHLNEAMLQAVFEARAWMDFLQQRGVPKIGVFGFSLGGYISSALAAVDDRPAFVIPNSPVVTTADMAMEWQPLGAALRLRLRLSNAEFGELRHILAVHSPLTYAPRVAPDRLMIVCGAGDRFTSPRFVSLLHEHWAGSQLHWFPGNHLLHLHQGEYLHQMKDFMDGHCGL